MTKPGDKNMKRYLQGRHNIEFNGETGSRSDLTDDIIKYDGNDYGTFYFPKSGETLAINTEEQSDLPEKPSINFT
jgi:hypothetical protein